MGLAPKQKFAFIVDNYIPSGIFSRNHDPENAWYRLALQALLMMLDPAVNSRKTMFLYLKQIRVEPGIFLDSRCGLLQRTSL